MMAGATVRTARTARVTLVTIVGLLELFVIGSIIFAKVIYDNSFPRVDRPRFTGRLGYGDVSAYGPGVVRFQSGKNTLTGYLYSRGNNKGLVVISPELGYGAKDYLAQTVYFVDRGWAVFSFDDTGTYASEGAGTLGLPQSAIDLNAAMVYIEHDDSLSGLPIMLFGHSWGGYAVTAVLNLDHNVRAVASIAGFNSPMELLHERMRQIIGPFSYVEYPFEWVYQEMLFGEAAGLKAVDGINKSQAAVMIVHRKNDGAIPYSSASIVSHRKEITNPNVIYRTSRLNAGLTGAIERFFDAHRGT